MSNFQSKILKLKQHLMELEEQVSEANEAQLYSERLVDMIQVRVGCELKRTYSESLLVHVGSVAAMLYAFRPKVFLDIYYVYVYIFQIDESL